MDDKEVGAGWGGARMRGGEEKGVFGTLRNSGVTGGEEAKDTDSHDNKVGRSKCPRNDCFKKTSLQRPSAEETVLRVQLQVEPHEWLSNHCSTTSWFSDTHLMLA